MNVLSQQVNNVESGGVVKGYELNINYLINNLTINVNGEVSFGVDIPNLLIPQNELLPSRLKLRDEISNILKSALKKDEEWQPLILGRIPKFYHSFLNRKDELRQLVQAIVCSQKGIILITGIGGIGKTWFVTEALHQITSSTFDNTSSNFLQFDNIFFVRCDEQTISLESLLLDIAGLSGIRQEALNILSRQSGNNFYQTIDFLFRLLNERSILLVFDNFEKLLTDLLILPGQLGDLDSFLGRMALDEHRSKLVITSRYVPARLGESRLNGWEHIPLINGLPESDALELLNQLKVDIGVEKAHFIIEKTYGIPKALENAGVLIQEGNISIDAFNANIQDKVVEELVQMQVKTLTDVEKKLLEYTSIFRLPFRRESCYWMFGDQQNIVDDAIKQLHLKRLIEIDREEYRLHPIIRSTIVEGLSIDMAKIYNLRAAEYYSLANWEKRPLSLDQLSHHLEAHYHYLQASEFDRAGIIANNLFVYLFRLGHFQLIIQLLSTTIETCQGVIQAMAKHQLARILFLQGKIEEANINWTDALKVYKRAKNRSGIAYTIHALGRIKQNRGEYRKALDNYQVALSTALIDNNYWQAGVSQHQIAYVYFLLGNYKKALAKAAKCLEYREQAQYDVGKAISLHLLGLIEDVLGNYTQAEKHFKESLEIEEEHGDKGRIAICERSLGNIYYYKGEYDKALELYFKSYEITKNLGVKLSMAECLDCISTVNADLGNLSNAKDGYLQSLEIRKSIKFTLGIAQSFRRLGQIATHQNSYSDASFYLRQGLDIAQKLGNKLTLIDLYLDMGFLAIQKRDFKDARSHLKLALKFSNQIGYIAGSAIAKSHLGELYHIMGNQNQAKQYLLSSKKILETLNRKPQIIRIESMLRTLENSK